MSGWIINREEWLKLFNEIIRPRLEGELNFEGDGLATLVLSRAIQSMPNAMTFEKLAGELGGYREAIVFGCGAGLRRDIEEFSRNSPSEILVISADGATGVLLQHGVLPGLIVTDLDGSVHDLMLANKKGAAAIVHAHGDNISSISKFVKLFEGPLLGSTQAEPAPFVYNFGGFTDGDRAAFIAYHLGVRRIYLAGFDLATPYSCPNKLVPFNREIKAKKLQVARDLLSYLRSKGVELLKANGEEYEL